MTFKGMVGTMLISGALALPGAAMAQGTASGGAGTGSSTAAATSGNSSGGAGGNYAENGLPSQRVVVNSTGQGAVLVVSGSGVREVQQVLNRLGYDAGPITGTWNKRTAEAMAQFQGAHGLEPNGDMTISSIDALGLWQRIIGNPIGNGNRGLIAENGYSGSPPVRGYGGGNGGNGFHSNSNGFDNGNGNGGGGFGGGNGTPPGRG